MSVTVKTLRPLSDLIGGGKISIEWSGGTLEDLIHYLTVTRSAQLERELIDEDGSLAYVFSINGKANRDLSAFVGDGDEVFIFTPIGGG